MPTESERLPSERAKRVRRKRPRRELSAPSARDPFDAQGRERPAFLLDFPHDPELERLLRAFESGNYALVRRDAPRLAETSDDPEVRDAAAELFRRIQPDPLIKYLLLASIALLAFLIAYVYGAHDHP
jgi:hypothetical protein